MFICDKRVNTFFLLLFCGVIFLVQYSCSIERKTARRFLNKEILSNVLLVNSNNILINNQNDSINLIENQDFKSCNINSLIECIDSNISDNILDDINTELEKYNLDVFSDSSSSMFWINKKSGFVINLRQVEYEENIAEWDFYYDTYGVNYRKTIPSLKYIFHFWFEINYFSQDNSRRELLYYSDYAEQLVDGYWEVDERTNKIIFNANYENLTRNDFYSLLKRVNFDVANYLYDFILNNQLDNSGLIKERKKYFHYNAISKAIREANNSQGFIYLK